MPFNPTLQSENGRQSPNSEQNVFEIDRFRKATAHAGFNDRTMLARKIHERQPNGPESSARIIPFDDVLKYRKKTQAVKRLQERTGLGQHDARDVIDSIEKRKISKRGIPVYHTPSRKKRLLWTVVTLAVACLVFFTIL